MTRMGESRRLGPWRVIALAGLGLEVGVVGWVLILTVREEVTRKAAFSSAGWAVVAYLALVVAALLLVTRGVYRRRPWTRAAGLTSQLLIVLAVGMPMLLWGQPPAGAAVILVAVLTAVAVIGAVPARTVGPWSDVESGTDPDRDTDPDADTHRTG